MCAVATSLVDSCARSNSLSGRKMDHAGKIGGWVRGRLTEDLFCHIAEKEAISTKNLEPARSAPTPRPVSYGLPAILLAAKGGYQPLCHGYRGLGGHESVPLVGIREISP